MSLSMVTSGQLKLYHEQECHNTDTMLHFLTLLSLAFWYGFHILMIFVLLFIIIFLILLLFR